MAQIETGSPRNCTFPDFEIDIPPKALIVSTPKSKSNSYGSSVFTRTSILISFPFFSQRLTCPTPHFCIPPVIVIRSIPCFLHIQHILWLTMVQEHLESTSVIHYLPQTFTNTVSNAKFTFCLEKKLGHNCLS